MIEKVFLGGYLLEAAGQDDGYVPRSAVVDREAISDVVRCYSRIRLFRRSGGDAVV